MVKLLICTTLVAASIGAFAQEPPRKAPGRQKEKTHQRQKSGMATKPQAAQRAMQPSGGEKRGGQQRRGEMHGGHASPAMHHGNIGHAAPPPHRHGIHAGRPDGARFWSRPAVPPPLHGALRGWSWVATPWNYTVDGVYYYGEGYYFDGYNYCYNGGYHLTPPPVVVAPAPVVAPVVAPPPPQPTPPPPPPQRKPGLLNILFGN